MRSLTGIVRRSRRSARIGGRAATIETVQVSTPKSQICSNTTVGIRTMMAGFWGA
jgi:hypothetical protein